MSREPPDQKSLKGMTTNERLFAFGLLEQYDEAERARDRTAMVTMLGQVGLADQAEKIADAVLAHPDGLGSRKL